MKSDNTPVSGNVESPKRALVTLRVLQVAATVPLLVLSALAVTGWATVTKIFDAAKDEPMSSEDLEILDGAWSFSVGFLVTAVVILTLALLSLVLSLVWLVYTVAPARREKAARGCRTHCCDLSWDIILTVAWGVLFVLSVVGKGLAMSILTGVVTALFLATAVLTERVRKQVRAQQAPQGPILSSGMV